MYVQDSIYDKFIEILVGKAKQLVIGDGFNEASGAGPVVSPPISSMVPWSCLVMARNWLRPWSGSTSSSQGDEGNVLIVAASTAFTAFGLCCNTLVNSPTVVGQPRALGRSSKREWH